MGREQKGERREEEERGERREEEERGECGRECGIYTIEVFAQQWSLHNSGTL